MKYVIYIMGAILALNFSTSIKSKTRIILAGDSTVAAFSQSKAPMCGWGQVFSDYFVNTEVINLATAGRSTKSFISEGRWQRLLDIISQGDYVFIQFGHNDEKIKDSLRGTAVKEFKSNLVKFVKDIKKKKGIPVLISPVMRRSVKKNEFYNSHKGYSEAVKAVATAQKVQFIDLTTKSYELLKKMGVENSKQIYLHAAPNTLPNYPKGANDNTHFNDKGAHLIAGLIIRAIADSGMPLASNLKPAYKKGVQSSVLIPDNLSVKEPTDGGLGGRVIKVTNLNACGEGSLRAALEAKGKRIIVFEVGGVIDMQKKTITVKNPFLTIAGQTAPSPGITLIKGGMQISTHDVVVQHISIRPGDASSKKGERFEPDGLTTNGAEAYNIIVDHCSITWAIDENLSASGPRNGEKSTSHNITFSNNIIAEGLYKASHTKGGHSMGTLIHDFVQDVAVVGNFYSCNNDRNPLFKSNTKGVIFNNVIYNPGQHAIRLTWLESEYAKLAYKPNNAKVAVVGNVLRKGPDSRKDIGLIMGKGDAYVEDNVAYGVNGEKTPVIYKVTATLSKRPCWINNFTPLDSKIIEEYLIENVGARPKDRDAVDKRIIQNYINREGKIINSQTEVGGYPAYKPVYRKLNVPDNNFKGWLNDFLKKVE